MHRAEMRIRGKVYPCENGFSYYFILGEDESKRIECNCVYPREDLAKQAMFQHAIEAAQDAAASMGGKAAIIHKSKDK